jgi:uncharacterized protein
LEVLGYIAAILIGISLGLIGGGGSILTVPVLVYLMGVSPVTSTAYSLFIVGTTALFGGLQKFRHGHVDVKSGIIFGIPSIIAVYLTRWFIIPALPEVVFSLGNYRVSSDMFIMVLFGLLMIMASISMIYQGKIREGQEPRRVRKNHYLLVVLEGFVVGLLTGLVGAGGGFLIIPALVLIVGLPMKTAVGTSLLIIAAKSLIGFSGDIAHMDMDWKMLVIFTLLAISGIVLGNRWSHSFDNAKLKKAFGWFVLIMGVYILFRETVFAV